MQFNPSFQTTEAVMNIHNTSQSQNSYPFRVTAAGVIGDVRAHIERDYSALLEHQPRLLRLALNEAEALAWQSGFPELIFPTLAEEKAGKVAIWHERQMSVQQARPHHTLAA